MKQKFELKNLFKSSEEVISMFLGLVIVVVAAGMIINFVQKKKGKVDVPGSSDGQTEQVTKEEGGTTGEKNANGNIYTVVAGDNLWKIAEAKYGSGYNWVDISKENNLISPGLLVVGQKLVIPTVEAKKATVVVAEKPVATVAVGDYKVVKGDNLWTIAVRAYGDGYRWVDIWNNNKNNLSDPDKLEIGMTLVLPKMAE